MFLLNCTFIAPDSTYRTDSVGGAYALSPVNHRATRRVVGMIMDSAALRKSRKEVGEKMPDILSTHPFLSDCDTLSLSTQLVFSSPPSPKSLWKVFFREKRSRSFVQPWLMTYSLLPLIRSFLCLFVCTEGSSVSLTPSLHCSRTTSSRWAHRFLSWMTREGWESAFSLDLQ